MRSKFVKKSFASVLKPCNIKKQFLNVPKLLANIFLFEGERDFVINVNYCYYCSKNWLNFLKNNNHFIKSSKYTTAFLQCLQKDVTQVFIFIIIKLTCYPRCGNRFVN